jgi:hypothetical protein
MSFMSTKPPLPCREHPADTLEQLALTIASAVPTEEPNDQVRLGYCLWVWLKEHRGSLPQAVHAASARSSVSPEEIVEIIRRQLDEKGIKYS